MSNTAMGVSFPASGGGVRGGACQLAIMSRQRTEINEMPFLKGAAEKKTEKTLYLSTSTLIIYITLISLRTFFHGRIHIGLFLFYRSSLTRQPPQNASLSQRLSVHMVCVPSLCNSLKSSSCLFTAATSQQEGEKRA